MQNDQKSIRLNPINYDTSIRVNPNQSETKFEIQINPIPIRPRIDPNRIFNQNQSESFPPWIHSVWINTKSDWCGLIWIANFVSDWFGFIRIDVLELIGLSRIVFDRFSLNEIQNVFRIGSEWFVLARIQISEWIGILLIDSEFRNMSCNFDVRGKLFYFSLGINIK